MRLATREQDFWTLRSAEASHDAGPETFRIPPAEVRRNLARGRAARLIFDVEADDDGRVVVNGERMWVIVAERVGDLYVGILDNSPATLEQGEGTYLCYGAEVPFGPEHVIDVADPPAEYAEWQLGEPPARLWPRA